MATEGTTTTTVPYARTDWSGHELRGERVRRIPDAQTCVTRTFCKCGARGGWSRLANEWDDDLWVCPHCGGPSRAAEEKTVALVFFRGGPLNTYVYDLPQVLDNQQLRELITQYNWTPEIVIGPQTGKTARVWVHKELPGEDDRQAEAAAALPPEPTPQDAVQEGVIAMPTTQAAGDLRQKRESAGASRTDLANLAGLSMPVIARIESGGTRTTDEERAKYSDALQKFVTAGGKPKKSAAPRGKKSASSGNGGSGDGKESGHTKGSQTPASDTHDTGGVVRLHEWNGLEYKPRVSGDMTAGTAVKSTAIPRTGLTFVAFTRNDKGEETIEVWETRRKRIRFVKPDTVQAVKRRRAG